MTSNSPPKRRALSEISGNAAKKPKLTASTSDSSTATKTHKQNIGGGSRMEWFNKLIDTPELQPALQNLTAKITNIETLPRNCQQVIGFTQQTRPTLDKKFKPLQQTLLPDAPERFSPYVISLAKNQVRIPANNPPSYPEHLRKVKQKRSSLEAAGNEKEATWVASHLCHNPKCINPEHLRWEPSWMNRLRDNCVGGEGCVHRPDRCLAAHRDPTELIDWTSYT